jgi:glycosyltransferase involved in cell wall biosynthesis
MKHDKKPRIFNLSLHRNGTQSITDYLRQANLRVLHFPGRVFGEFLEIKVAGHELDDSYIIDVLSSPLDLFDAFCDVPLNVVYRKLSELYPDALFFAVQRNVFEWIKSVRGHCGGREFHIYERCQYWRYLHDRPTSIDEVSDAQLMEMYHRHYQELKEYFAESENFRIFNLNDQHFKINFSSFLDIKTDLELRHIDATKKNRRLRRDRFRFHVLAVPHTITHSDYSSCAFTQKVRRLCSMLSNLGHEVIHYGNEDSIVQCTEHVTVTTRSDLETCYGDHDWRKSGFPKFSTRDSVYSTFDSRCIREIELRKSPNDFLLCSYGAAHKVVADAHSDLIVCEPGIGYPSGHFAPFKVFESYAMLHAFHGLAAVKQASNSHWYDVVIPNYFDPKDFDFSLERDSYFVFLGRLNEGKGLHIALDIAERTGRQLVIAGPDQNNFLERHSQRFKNGIEYLGVIGPDERKGLLARAAGVLCPSTYLEPFCGVHIEALFSGAAAITTDWGAFAEFNVHGYTGYRCRTMEQFVWATENVSAIEPINCRKWAVDNFSVDRVASMYEEYFSSVMDIFSGEGWYQERQGRANLNWLKKKYDFPVNL